MKLQLAIFEINSSLESTSTTVSHFLFTLIVIPPTLEEDVLKNNFVSGHAKSSKVATGY